MGSLQGAALSERIIGLGIEVHRRLGPGLLETAYEECLAYELRASDIAHQRQVALPVVYKEVRLEAGYRMDFVVEDELILEIKAVERLLPIHEAQLLTYLKLSGYKVGLLMNLHSITLKEGLRRLVV